MALVVREMATMMETAGFRMSVWSEGALKASMRY